MDSKKSHFLFPTICLTDILDNIPPIAANFLLGCDFG